MPPWVFLVQVLWAVGLLGLFLAYIHGNDRYFAKLLGRSSLFLKPGGQTPSSNKAAQVGGGGTTTTTTATTGATAALHPMAAAAAIPSPGGTAAAAVPTAGPREAGSLPLSSLAAGAVNNAMPFDHIVVVMMENHSFDNLLGDLSRTRGYIDGLTFDPQGNPINSNPASSSSDPEVKAFALKTTAQGRNVTQSWQATHEQIDEGKMDGFVKTAKGTSDPMGYYTEQVLPFAYSLARQFTVANRWFSSVPGPTYPNRRFLLAGTAFGGTTTKPETLLDDPPTQGTIFDRLTDHGVSWANYFTDIPMTLTIPSIFIKHTGNHHPIEKFFKDCEAGTLPAVSFVDPAMGLGSSIVASLGGLPPFVKDALNLLGIDESLLTAPSETEENPGDMYDGEIWAYKVVDAVVRSPAWSRTLLIYLYDEHGGYYDHVPPPAAMPPDDIPAKLENGGTGTYDMYGPRVPAVIVSPYSRPAGASSTIYDHTSVLATIEHKWNLPALTRRDANAATVMDCLDLSKPSLLAPVPLEEPSNTGPSGPTNPPH